MEKSVQRIWQWWDSKNVLMNQRHARISDSRIPMFNIWDRTLSRKRNFQKSILSSNIRLYWWGGVVNLFWRVTTVLKFDWPMLKSDWFKAVKCQTKLLPISTDVYFLILFLDSSLKICKHQFFLKKLLITLIDDSSYLKRNTVYSCLKFLTRLFDLLLRRIFTTGFVLSRMWLEHVAKRVHTNSQVAITENNCKNGFSKISLSV